MDRFFFCLFDFFVFFQSRYNYLDLSFDGMNASRRESPSNSPPWKILPTEKSRHKTSLDPWEPMYRALLAEMTSKTTIMTTEVEVVSAAAAHSKNRTEINRVVIDNF